MPTYSPKLVDPLTWPVTLSLQPHDLDRRDPELILRGRVADENGKPVAGAVVTPFGFKTPTGSQFGGLKGIDAMAVTNDKGQFRIGVAEKGTALYLSVTARFLAPQRPEPIAAGKTIHEIKMLSGVTVSGRVIKDGKGLGGITLGLVQKDRNVERFVGEFKISTDERGQFMFPNVPPQEAYSLYGLMDSCRKHGAIRVQTLQLGKNGTTSDVGTLTVQSGSRLSGRVILSDGKPLPANTRVLISREEAWDSQTVTAAADGSFVFEGLPAEKYMLTVNVRDYRISPKNASYDLLNGSGLIGTVNADSKDLKLFLEPGPRVLPDYSKFRKEDYQEHERRQKSPLQGATTICQGP